MDTKFCKHCNQDHPRTEEFWTRKRQGNTIQFNNCKVYYKVYNKAYQESNRDSIKSAKREYEKEHRESLRAKAREYRAKNKEKVQAYQKLYRSNNRDRRREYDKNKLLSCPQSHLSKVLRTRLHHAMRGRAKFGSAVRDLGCSVEELKVYLEGKFLPGMTWENWALDGWHIDHIQPLASFDLSVRDQLLKAVHYTNLQPLWAKDNLSKNKY